MKGYIRYPSNVIDFFVCFCEVLVRVSYLLSLNLSKYDSLLRSFKILRVIRCLRPLRIICRSEGLKLAVNSLFKAIPAIGNGMMVCGLVVLIYSIAGISFFKGKFKKCVVYN